MDKKKHYKYPFGLELIIRGHSGVMIGIIIVLVIFFAIIVAQFRAFEGMLVIIIPAFLAIISFVFLLLLANLLVWPQVELKDGKFRLVGLFAKSQWIDVEDIISTEYKLLLRDPSGLFESIFVDKLGIFKRTLVVESADLPWICRFSRLIVGKKNPVFLIGERIDGFDELRALFEGN